MRVLLASLALASAVDHPPVSCDEADSGSLCKRVVDQLIAGDWFRTELPCTTCTEGMITCGMWQAPNFAPENYASDICAQALAMALPAFGFTRIRRSGPLGGLPGDGVHGARCLAMPLSAHVGPRRVPGDLLVRRRRQVDLRARCGARERRWR